ncbi:hypothetical protein GTW64_02990 [Streptomyces sp. SID4923]|nr:hypothetical protein [Streptomyces sp. SID4923]
MDQRHSSPAARDPSGIAPDPGSGRTSHQRLRRRLPGPEASDPIAGPRRTQRGCHLHPDVRKITAAGTALSAHFSALRAP